VRGFTSGAGTGFISGRAAAALASVRVAGGFASGKIARVEALLIRLFGHSFAASSSDGTGLFCGVSIPLIKLSRLASAFTTDRTGTCFSSTTMATAGALFLSPFPHSSAYGVAVSVSSSNAPLYVDFVSGSGFAFGLEVCGSDSGVLLGEVRSASLT